MVLLSPWHGTMASGDVDETDERKRQANAGGPSKRRRDRAYPTHRHTKSVEMPVPTRKRMMQDGTPSMGRGIQAYVPIHAAAFLPIMD